MNEKEKQNFLDIIESVKQLRLRKSADYGTSWKIFGLEGVLYQIRSKFVRIMNLTDKNREDAPANESLRDSFIDMANYAIMAVQLIDMNEVDDKFSELLRIEAEIKFTAGGAGGSGSSIKHSNF